MSRVDTKKLGALALSLTLAVMASDKAAADANIIIINLDGPGEGFNLNLPLAPRSGWDTYGPALDEALRRVAAHGTDVLVVALGVDTAAEDGVLSFGEADFRRLGAALAGAGLPTVLVQEGGYDLGVLGRNVVAVLDGFAQHA